MNGNDPYDRSEVIAACARHAWERRAAEFKDHGIDSESDLRAYISKTIEGRDTQAFRSQPMVLENQTVGREVYAASFHSPASLKDYRTIVFLNPNRDERGRLHGGTCMIRSVQKRTFSHAIDDEKDAAGKEPLVMKGGRPALRSQEWLEVSVREIMKREAVPGRTLGAREHDRSGDRER